MAQVQPPPQNPPHPPTNGQPGPSPNHSQPPPISWEGDRMFNVYIHDYFIKRGFHKAAKELVIEADIANDPCPPINARQGFLFEWWNVFWVFFSAKTTQQGPENVLLYIQWMQNQADRNRAADPSRLSHLGLPGQPRMMHRGGMPPNPMRPPGPLLNGVPMPPVGQSQPPIATQGTPYPMSGIPGGPQPPPQHQQTQPGPSQMNGIVDSNNLSNNVGQPSQRPPSQQQSIRPPPPQQPLPPPSHPNAIPHLQPGQRQINRPHGPGQFQSPTMAPAHPPGVSPHPQMGPPQMGMVPPGISQNAPHLSQHAQIMRGPPSQGCQPANNTSPRGPVQTPTQGFQQPLVNPGVPPAPQGSVGSRSNTPATTMVSHRSPLMMHNESTSPGHSMSDDMNRRFPMVMQGSRPPQQPMIPSHPQHPNSQQPSRPGTSQSFNNPELHQLEQDLARIPPVFLASMKQEAGVPDVQINELTDEQKTSLNEVFKRTMSNFNGTLATGSRPVRHGMTQMQPMGGMMGPPQASQLRQQQSMPPQSQGQGPGVTQRGQKRTSASPGDEGQGDMTPKDQSPPDRKRQRQSPQVGIRQPIPIGGDLNPNAAPLSQMSPMGGFPSGHPPNHLGASYPGSGTTQFANGFRPGPVGNPPMPGHPTPVPNTNVMGSLTPNMGHAIPPGSIAPMNPALANQHIHQMPGSQNIVMSQQQGQFRHPVTPGAHMHKMPGSMSGITNQSVTPDQTAANRTQPQQNKPGSMMPPPSPAHRPESINVPKSAGMMQPPAQPTPTGTMNNNSGPIKEQTAPSPARIDGQTGPSPSIRPASRSGAGTGASAPQSSTPSSNLQTAPGNSLTPAPSGTTGASNPPNAPSPSSSLSNRISPPTAAIGSLPRPQTSGPDSGSNAQANNANNNSTSAATTNGPAPPAPSLSAPPSTSAPLDSIFTGFFDTMEDNFGLEGLEIDPNDFSQWIDMNPIN